MRIAGKSIVPLFFVAAASVWFPAARALRADADAAAASGGVVDAAQQYDAIANVVREMEVLKAKIDTQTAKIDTQKAEIDALRLETVAVSSGKRGEGRRGGRNLGSASTNKRDADRPGSGTGKGNGSSPSEIVSTTLPPPSCDGDVCRNSEQITWVTERVVVLEERRETADARIDGVNATATGAADGVRTLSVDLAATRADLAATNETISAVEAGVALLVEEELAEFEQNVTAELVLTKEELALTKEELALTKESLAALGERVALRDCVTSRASTQKDCFFQFNATLPEAVVCLVTGPIDGVAALTCQQSPGSYPNGTRGGDGLCGGRGGSGGTGCSCPSTGCVVGSGLPGNGGTGGRGGDDIREGVAGGNGGQGGQGGKAYGAGFTGGTGGMGEDGGTGGPGAAGGNAGNGGRGGRGNSGANNGELGSRGTGGAGDAGNCPVSEDIPEGGPATCAP